MLLSHLRTENLLHFLQFGILEELYLHESERDGKYRWQCYINCKGERKCWCCYFWKEKKHNSPVKYGLGCTSLTKTTALRKCNSCCFETQFGGCRNEKSWRMENSRWAGQTGSLKSRKFQACFGFVSTKSASVLATAVIESVYGATQDRERKLSNMQHITWDLLFASKLSLYRQATQPVSPPTILSCKSGIQPSSFIFFKGLQTQFFLYHLHFNIITWKTKAHLVFDFFDKEGSVRV